MNIVSSRIRLKSLRSEVFLELSINVALCWDEKSGWFFLRLFAFGSFKDTGLGCWMGRVSLSWLTLPAEWTGCCFTSSCLQAQLQRVFRCGQAVHFLKTMLVVQVVTVHRVAKWAAEQNQLPWRSVTKPGVWWLWRQRGNVTCVPAACRGIPVAVQFPIRVLQPPFAFCPGMYLSLSEASGIWGAGAQSCGASWRPSCGHSPTVTTCWLPLIPASLVCKKSFWNVC